MKRPTLTDAEVIRALERLAARWPPNLILFGGPHTLSLLRRDTYRVLRHFTIPADGGDPGDLPYEVDVLPRLKSRDSQDRGLTPETE